jgi:hypothetical protein
VHIKVPPIDTFTFYKFNYQNSELCEDFQVGSMIPRYG